MRYLLACVAVFLGAYVLALPLVPRRLPYAAVLDSASTKENTPPSPQLTAGAVVVYDPLYGKFLFEKNPDTSFGIASITKIMTAIVALEHVGENEIIEVSNEAVALEGNEGSLRAGEHFVLWDLVILMLAESSNDAAAALAEHTGKLSGADSFEESQEVFTRFMNETAREIGLGHTYFKNPTGLDIDEAAGIISNVSTARETAMLIGYALHYPLIRDMRMTPSTIISHEGIAHTLSSTHALLMSEPGILSGKTGFTDSAGGTLATAAEIPFGKLSIVVVLDSTKDARFEDTLYLLDWLRIHPH